MLFEVWRKTSQQIQRRMKLRRGRETLPLPVLHTGRVMLPPVPLALFNQRCKTPLKNLLKPLSLDSPGQDCSRSALPMNIFPGLGTASSASQVDTPCLHSHHHPTAPLASPEECRGIRTEMMSWASSRPTAPSLPVAAALSWPANHCEWPRRGNEFPGPSATKPEKLIRELY